MKLGIFGGSFNPPHKKHENIAHSLIEENYVDKVIFVPVGEFYPKKDLAPFKDRLAMLKLISDKSKLICSDIANNEAYKYTYQVLDYFKNKYNADIYFICGMDNLIEFDTWKNYEYVLKNYKLLVINRNNTNTCEILKKYHDYLQNIIITNIEENNISSSLIRNRINDDEFLKENLNSKVYKYIKNNFSLYRQCDRIYDNFGGIYERNNKK